MEVLFYLGICVAVGYFAESRGRSCSFWGIGAFFISPVLAFLILLFLRDLKQDQRLQEQVMNQETLRERVALNEVKNNRRFENLEKKVDVLEKTTGVAVDAAPAKELTATIYCTECGTACTASSRFCSNCGHSLGR